MTEELPQRRESDTNNLLFKLYLQYREVVHVTGFIVLLAFTLGGNWSKWEAQAHDIEDLKSRMTQQEIASGRILQSLDDIKDFLHVPQRPYQ